MKFINFGKIKQFRDIVRDIKHSARFRGVDDNDNPIYDHSIQLPKLEVIATEKIHGTNAAVCFCEEYGLWGQSRKNIITPKNDNAGCAKYIEQNKIAWLEIIQRFIDFYKINCKDNIISIYFEWCGGNIQRNSAISGLDKRAIIFPHFKVTSIEKLADDECYECKWYQSICDSCWIDDQENNIYNIMNFPYYQFDIDFENPSLSQNQFIELVEDVIEPNSPVGQAMGKDGNIGEGVVVSFFYKRELYKFKVKGEKHSKSNVKTLKPVDEVHEQIKIDFANYACSSSRLNQAWQEIFGIDNEKEEPSMRKMGNFLGWMFKNIMEEESDIMCEKDLTQKMVKSKIVEISKKWFMDQLNNF